MLSQAKEEKMTKHTDTQLIVLSKAAAQENAAGVVPDRMNKATAAKVQASLVSRKLMREIRSKVGMPVWRKDEDGHAISLVITRAGRDAIGVEDDVGKFDERASGKSGDAKAADRRASTAAPRRGSKQALVVDMLLKDKGVTLDALVKATGWLLHTTWAALTGLRKRGFSVQRIQHETKGSLYRITSRPASARV